MRSFIIQNLRQIYNRYSMNFFVLKFCKERNGENPFFTAAADGAADLIRESPNALHAQAVVFAPLAFG